MNAGIIALRLKNVRYSHITVLLSGKCSKAIVYTLAIELSK